MADVYRSRAPQVIAFLDPSMQFYFALGMFVYLGHQKTKYVGDEFRLEDHICCVLRCLGLLRIRCGAKTRTTEEGPGWRRAWLDCL